MAVLRRPRPTGGGAVAVVSLARHADGARGRGGAMAVVSLAPPPTARVIEAARWPS
jgi:hypothetical protein